MRAKDAEWYFEVRINDRVHYIEVEEKLDDMEQEIIALQAEIQQQKRYINYLLEYMRGLYVSASPEAMVTFTSKGE